MINKKYGGKKGFIVSIKYKLLYLLPIKNRLKNNTLRKVKRLVFICKGNICRSPYAEEVSKKLCFHAISFGLEAQDGNNAYKKSIEISKNNNIDLSNHKALNIKNYQPQDNDLIICFEPEQEKQVKCMLDEKGNITLLGLYYYTSTPYIHDPFGLCDEYFENCFDIIFKSVKNLITKIRKEC